MYTCICPSTHTHTHTHTPSLPTHSVFLMDKYQVSSGYANILNSLVYIISAVASPFLGFLVDKTGFNVFWCKLI